jgi:PEP-CTERM motif
MFQYSFELILLPDSTLQTGGFVTIYDIPFLPLPPAPPPLTSQPSLSWGSETEFLGKTPTGFIGTDNPALYNVTWQWNGAQINPMPNDMDLGRFTIGTTIELSSPPSVALVYVGSLDGVTASNQGIVLVNVPEPSSVVLLLAGVGTLPVFWLRERRRRLSRQAG